MKEKLPTKAVVTEPLPDASAVRYRTLFITPKRDFGTGFLIKGKMVTDGWIVTDGTCNIMPGATWFETVEEAKFAIDVLIAVQGDADMFWEIMQPFKHTPGEKSEDSDTNCTTTHGRHYAKYEGGICVEVGVMENPPKY
jgi:hypothetical protein